MADPWVPNIIFQFKQLECRYCICDVVLLIWTTSASLSANSHNHNCGANHTVLYSSVEHPINRLDSTLFGDISIFAVEMKWDLT